jgi:hypothetical protein
MFNSAQNVAFLCLADDYLCIRGQKKTLNHQTLDRNLHFNNTPV